MVAKDFNKTNGWTKAEVGEIDTSAPFQSVKDAVSLFGEGAFSGEKPVIRKAKSHSAERAVAKEMQLHLAQKELHKLKEQLKNAEATKAEALVELDRAKRTVEDLSEKLKSINGSKDSVISATAMAKHQAKRSADSNGSTHKDLETSRTEYMAAATELDAAKRELRKICGEYDAFVKAKETASKQAAEAENSAKSNMERVGELSKEITSVQDLIQQGHLASTRANEEGTIIFADSLCKTRPEELVEKSIAFKKHSDSDVIKNLETQLCETMSEIDSMKAVSLELGGAKESLCKVTEEEHSQRNLVETLKVELDIMRKEHSGLKEKEVESESISGNLHVKLRKAKSELEEALTEEAQARGASDEMIETIRLLTLECENMKLEAEKTRQQADQLKREAEATRIELEEAETRLRITVHEAEEAKAAEVKAIDQIQMLSAQTDAARASTSETGAQITVSREEYESLCRKAGECEKIAEMKVAAIMAQVEAVKASENEAIKRLEAMRKEIEEMKAVKEAAFNKAEMAQAAKTAVEGELRRWREREQKKAAEEASRVVGEREKSLESSPLYYRGEKQSAEERVVERGKLEKAKTYVAKKVLMPSLGGVFHKKKNQVESDAACLSDEKHQR